MNKALQVMVLISRVTLEVNTLSQDINIQNMNVELVAQMFKNYQSNVLFHLEGMADPAPLYVVTRSLTLSSHREFEASGLIGDPAIVGWASGTVVSIR